MKSEVKGTATSKRLGNNGLSFNRKEYQEYFLGVKAAGA